jgi:hypothetical protein
VDLHTKVHGVSHENDNGSDRQDNIEMCAVGDIVSLIREPANEFDRNAIAVYAPGVGQIGFVSSALSEDLAPAMDRGTFILAEISDVTGGTEEKPMWGVNLRLRQTTEESVAAAIRQQCDVAESRKAARRAAMAGYDARMRAVKKPWFSWFKC